MQIFSYILAATSVCLDACSCAGGLARTKAHTYTHKEQIGSKNKRGTRVIKEISNIKKERLKPERELYLEVESREGPATRQVHSNLQRASALIDATKRLDSVYMARARVRVRWRKREKIKMPISIYIYVIFLQTSVSGKSP